jgi:acylphosphatase
MKAVQYKITGWVKNTQDGNVEMVAVGEKENMDQFIEDLRQGNPFSSVSDLKIQELTETEPFQSFKIKY